MRRQSTKQPLVQNNEGVKEEKVSVEKIDQDFKAGNGKAPLPYEVPPNYMSSKIYVPIIKNTISEDEMRWKDGYEFVSVTSPSSWNSYVLPGIELTKSKTGITSEGDWISTPTGVLAVPYTILGDGLPFFAKTVGITKKPLAQYRNPLFTITESMTIIFSGLSWGYAFLLRLIDDRIQNSAGRNDPQAVCYSPTAHVIKTTCQGWYNVGNQESKITSSKPIWYNLCMRGQVTLLYDWNTLHSGNNVVCLVTKEETYDEND